MTMATGQTGTSPGSSAGGRLRVLVLGYIVRGPLGGMAWHHLQYVMGLARLGHDVWFVEDSGDTPACYDPATDETTRDPSAGLRFATAVFDRVGLGERWAYHDAHTGRWLGPAAGRMPAECARADLLLNVSAINPLRPWLAGVPARALIDTDPAFTQIRHLTSLEARALALGHTTFFSFGENIGRPGAAVPDDGLPWQPTRQPVVLDAWPVTPGRPRGRFTTVMHWDSYPAREYRGQEYGMKSKSFWPYSNLPLRLGPRFELAVGNPTVPAEVLRERGWRLRDSHRRTRDPWRYQRYIQCSHAEFSVAKHGYVVSRSGWFSERSAAYLASGRPVVTQETGFSQWLPAGEGVLAFNNPPEAKDAIAELESRYDFHCRRAREVAEEYFDARRVLTHLVERALRPQAAPPPAGPVTGAQG
jgi:hypothetical protein